MGDALQYKDGGMAEALGIDAAVYYLPEQRLSIAEWGAANHQPDSIVQALLGNGHRYFHRANGLLATDLARRALAKLFRENDIDHASVDVLIYVHTISSSIPVPPRNLPLMMKAEFNMNKAICFSLSQLNCASMIGAIRIVRSLMDTNPQWKSAVIVSADVFYRDLERNVRTNGIMCDGASAAFICKNPKRNRIGSIVVENCGQFHLGSNMSDDAALNFSQRAQIITYKAIKRAIELSGQPLTSFKRLLPSNFNMRAWVGVPKLFGRDADFLFSQNISDKGHACCSDGLINLVDGDLIDLAAGSSVVVFARGNTGAFGAFTLHGL